MFIREPLVDVLPQLVATARGDRPATLVVRGGRLVNVCSGEILDDMSVAVQGSRIAYVGRDPGRCIGEQTRVIDAAGRYIAPGLLDAHCHIESTMLTPGQFARAVLPLGTTGGFFDAHEIANVFGLKGLRLMLDEVRTTPLAAYMQVASCVPASSAELETTGAALGPAEVAEALAWGPDMIGLGEVMNFPGVVFGDPKMLGEIQATLRAGRLADGHFTWPPDDWRLAAYAAAGVTGDHEVTTADDAAWRIRLGMYAMLRRGSAWHDVAATVRAITERGLDPRRIVLCTDDRSPESLLDEGHMNFVVRHAIQQGVRPVTALQMATLNTAERWGVQRDVGSLVPGAYADIILLDGNLADVRVTATIAAGQLVAEQGRMVVDWPAFAHPPEVTGSVHLARPLAPADFVIAAPVQAGEVRARAIRVIENHAETEEITVSVPVAGGQVRLDPAGGLCKIAVFERHSGRGGHALGLVAGAGFDRPAAIASTVAHDSHNLLIIGNDDALMARAGQQVADLGGGVAVVTAEGAVTLPLPIAGLMSAAPFAEVAACSRAVSQALAAAGCRLNYAFMTLSLLALVVIPQLRLSDLGLVRVSASGFERVGLFVD